MTNIRGSFEALCQTLVSHQRFRSMPTLVTTRLPCEFEILDIDILNMPGPGTVLRTQHVVAQQTNADTFGSGT